MGASLFSGRRRRRMGPHGHGGTTGGAYGMANAWACCSALGGDGVGPVDPGRPAAGTAGPEAMPPGCWTAAVLVG